MNERFSYEQKIAIIVGIVSVSAIFLFVGFYFLHKDSFNNVAFLPDVDTTEIEEGIDQTRELWQKSFQAMQESVPEQPEEDEQTETSETNTGQAHDVEQSDSETTEQQDNEETEQTPSAGEPTPQEE